jgi:hypothetical protein
MALDNLGIEYVIEEKGTRKLLVIISVTGWEPPKDEDDSE